MEVTFDVPHAFSGDSSPSEKSAMRDSFERALQKMNAAKGPKASVYHSGPTQVTFRLPNAFHENSTYLVNATTLRALLTCLTEFNIIALRGALARGIHVPKLYDSGVVYKRTVVWDSIPALYRRQYGDCKSLACALTAEHLADGHTTENSFRFTMDGKRRRLLYHILNLTPWGWEDPSKALGMGRDENSYMQTG